MSSVPPIGGPSGPVLSTTSTSPQLSQAILQVVERMVDHDFVPGMQAAIKMYSKQISNMTWAGWVLRAIKHDSPNVLRELVKDSPKTIHVTTKNKKHNALHLAARYGSLNVARVLATLGIHVTATTTSGKTAADIAFKKGHIALCLFLQGETQRRLVALSRAMSGK